MPRLKSDVSASSCLDLEELFAEMTIRDTPAEEEESRFVRTAQQTQQLTPADMETLGHSYQKQSCKESATQSTGDPNMDRSKGLEQFRIGLRQKLTRSGSTWTTMSSIAQWLEGANRIRPCCLLSSIDTKSLLTWLGQKHGLTIDCGPEAKLPDLL